MSRSYVMIDLDDPRAAKLADIMSNATCKQILSLLAEQELSESEIAERLGARGNTINYNVKKLVGAGLIVPVRSLWSRKGRAVKVYRVSQKKIVLSPTTSLKGVLPVLGLAFLGAIGIRAWEMSSRVGQDARVGAEKVSEGALSVASYAAPAVSVEPVSGSYIWVGFLGGACLALGALWLWHYFRR